MKFQIVRSSTTRTHLFLLLSCMAIYLFFFNILNWLFRSEGYTVKDRFESRSADFFGKFHKDAPVIITIVCQEEQKDLINSAVRQMRQVTTMIKSAAVLSRSFINFIIVVNKDSTFDTIMREVIRWPAGVSRRLHFQKRPVWLPEKNVFMEPFRLCSTAKLFIAERIVADIDEAIYVDTDVVFMKSPEELWREFRYFNSEQICGLVGTEWHKLYKKIPFYGNVSVDTGMWMMNMTRMRRFPNGWENALIKTYKKYRKSIRFPGRQIVNVIFNKTPQYFYNVGCQWNFQNNHCLKDKITCEEAKRKGAHLIHGNDMMFFLYDLKFQMVFKAWRFFQPGQPLPLLLHALKKSLKITDSFNTTLKRCSRVKEIDSILTKGLEDYISEP